MTVRIYAERKEWPLERVSVRLRHSRIHAEDCADCETKEGMLDRIECVVELEGALDAAQSIHAALIAETYDCMHLLKLGLTSASS